MLTSIFSSIFSLFKGNSVEYVEYEVEKNPLLTENHAYVFIVLSLDNKECEDKVNETEECKYKSKVKECKLNPKAKEYKPKVKKCKVKKYKVKECKSKTAVYIEDEEITEREPLILRYNSAPAMSTRPRGYKYGKSNHKALRKNKKRGRQPKK